MRRGPGFEVKVWLMIVTAGSAPLVGCGGRANSNDATAGGTSLGGASTAPSGASGGGGVDSAGAADEPPPPVDPSVSRAWTWQPCGTLEPAAADRAARFDASGAIVVLGPSTVRVYGANGERTDLAAGVSADFLVTSPDGAVLSGRTTETGIALTPVGESAPGIVLPNAPAGACGSEFAISADGAYVVASGEDLGCAWRVSDSSFVGSVAGDQVTVRNAGFVGVERSPSSTDVVLHDFTGRELSRRQLAAGSVTLSPAGDRAVVDSDLIDLDTGKVVPWDFPPTLGGRLPLFSPRGDRVLVGDGIFSAADGVRRFSLDPESRLARYGTTGLVLSPDGSRAVTSGYGRATLFDVGTKGVSAVLGPPLLPDPMRGGHGTSALAISRDGSLLLHNLEGSGASGIRLASSFGDSQVIWDMFVELNLSVDVSTDGRLAAIGGDGRAIYDGRDGHEIWEALPPPPGVDICLLDGLRFSPKATWLAGGDYSKKLQIFRLNGADGVSGAAPWQPLLELPAHCDSPAFSRDERLLATSAAALYRTGAAPGDWTQLWSSPLPVQTSDFGFASSDVQFSPDGTQLLVSHCAPPDGRCVTTLLSVATGAVSGQLQELTGPHPSFSPEGSWIVAANTLLHLPSGEVRSLAAAADPSNPALFTPNGDIIAGSTNGTLTRYCRKQ